MRVEEPFDNLYSFNSVLTMDEYSCLNEEFDPKYTNWMITKRELFAEDNHPMRGNLLKTPSNATIGDNLQLLRIGSLLKLHIERVLNKKLHMYRINTNIQLYGMTSTFHRDGDVGSWTFLLFCSNYWNTEWGGEFVVKDSNGVYQYFAYIPNNGVLFPAHLEHKGQEPNRLCNIPRLSVAFSFSECVV